MMREEVVFSNLSELIEEKERISNEYAKDKWKVFSYSTGKCSGNMLVSPENSYPDSVSFDMNLSGLYHIYVCLPKFACSSNYINLKLSSDPGYIGITASDLAPFNWLQNEYMEEVYWKTADLTGEKFVIKKSRLAHRRVPGIAWVRCVPAEEKTPVILNKCVQMHLDEDVVAVDSFENDNDYLAKLYPIKDSNAEFVSFEFSFDYDKLPEQKDAHLLKMDAVWDENMYKYISKKDMIYKKAVKYAKENGFGIYAANRMEVGNFITSYTRYGWNMNFVKDNPHLLCRTRTGTRVNVCSYAYPQVQDFVISQFVNVIKYGFDGITLICHRGIHIGFDEPVLKRFGELYPSVDPHLLPFEDERLHGVWCEFMNEFMTKLRRAVGSEIKINVITDYSLKTAKNLGLDVEFWAKNGLVDCVSQADMEIFEDLEGCMDDNNPELIDMEKYKYQLTQRNVVRRNFCKNVDKVCKHIPEYESLKAYGVDVYHVLPWMFTTPPDEYRDIVERMKKCGATKFLCWNTNHVMNDLSEWNTVRTIGSEPVKETLRSFHRVLSIDGYDVSQIYPNWRG